MLIWFRLRLPFLIFKNCFCENKANCFERRVVVVRQGVPGDEGNAAYVWIFRFFISSRFAVFSEGDLLSEMQFNSFKKQNRKPSLCAVSKEQRQRTPNECFLLPLCPDAQLLLQFLFTDRCCFSLSRQSRPSAAISPLSLSFESSVFVSFLRHLSCLSCCLSSLLSSPSAPAGGQPEHALLSVSAFLVPSQFPLSKMLVSAAVDLPL
ncbi:hypothetical protein TGARI_201730 [Toxoplasma gondii ARI]|uniref:Transmembrane protein n=1 Tax=Toxoplasma gondii ARI TaxID=1074872 RepID=A0A139XZ45_TOXGO|nr:hypothetical protein TGARI_201730 [Toxoplasma gondii ARI]